MIKIREANITDAKNIASLAIQVWLDTYAVKGIRSAFSNYIWEELTPNNYSEKIKNKTRKIFLAEEKKHLVGFVELNENSLSPVDENSQLEIDKLYIQNNFCGKNIGSQIINYLNDKYKTSEYLEMWLTVYEGNERAINFYKKNKFEEVGDFYFELENESHRNLVMIKKLN